MRVYTDVIQDKGAYIQTDAFTDAVITLTPEPGEFIKASWIFWSFQSDPEPAWLRIKDLTNGDVFLFAWIKNIQGPPQIKSWDILNFGSEGEVFLPDHVIEFRLSGTSTKWMTVSYS